MGVGGEKLHQPGEIKKEVGGGCQLLRRCAQVFDLVEEFFIGLHEVDGARCPSFQKWFYNTCD